MEYTLSAMTAASIVVLMDRTLRTRVLHRKAFWIFLCVMFVFKIIVNGYLTWRPIVLYGDRHFLGIRLGTIPVEDFLYGFALITTTIILWEYFKRKTNRLP